MGASATGCAVLADIVKGYATHFEPDAGKALPDLRIVAERHNRIAHAPADHVRSPGTVWIRPVLGQQIRISHSLRAVVIFDPSRASRHGKAKPVQRFGGRAEGYILIIYDHTVESLARNIAQIDHIGQIGQRRSAARAKTHRRADMGTCSCVFAQDERGRVQSTGLGHAGADPGALFFGFGGQRLHQGRGGHRHQKPAYKCGGGKGDYRGKERRDRGDGGGKEWHQATRKARRAARSGTRTIPSVISA